MKRFRLLAITSVLGTLMLASTVMASKSTRQADIDLPFGQRSIMSDRAIRARTAPLGALCVDGMACAESTIVATAPEEEGTVNSGEAIYQTYCMACHANAVGGAPKTHDPKAWEGRKNLSSVINGLGIMPARGGCTTCSDEELQSAIDFMSE